MEERIDIGVCLFHHEHESIQEMMNKCFEGISIKDVRSRAFGYVFDDKDSTFVHNVVKLALQDSGMDGTNDEVRAQIVERAKMLSQQMLIEVVPEVQVHLSESDRKKQFLDSPDMSRHPEGYFPGIPDRDGR